MVMVSKTDYSGVNGPAETGETALGRESGPYVGLIDKKNLGSKIS
jgi:hypothetical protein